MNTQQQAYIEGFVKRASEYGFSEEEALNTLKAASHNVYDLEQQKASLPANVLTAMALGKPDATMLGASPIAYNAYQDLSNAQGSPSRTANISGGTILGDLAGAGIGYGASQLLGQQNPEEIQHAIDFARLGGRALGSGLGVKRYNQKMDEMINQAKQEQGW